MASFNIVIIVSTIRVNSGSVFFSFELTALVATVIWFSAIVKRTITDADDFIQITIPPGAYEIESLNDEIKRIIIDEGRYSENDYPFRIKPNFSTLGRIIEIQPQGLIFSFVFEDSIRNLGFHETIIYDG